MTMHPAAVSRRGFAVGLGAVLVGFTLAPRATLAQAPRLPGSLAGTPMLDAWLRIGADGVATVFTGKVELGQGIVTALAQIAAEELDLPLDRVRMISGDTGQTPDEGFTAGSQSIENSGAALRFAAAEARAILIELAARRLGVGPEALRVADGVIAAPDGRRIGYGELAGEGILHRSATAKVAPKPPAQHRIVGKSVPRLDIAAKVTGGAAYVQDLRLPGMLHGRVVRPPRYDATLDGVDEGNARAVAGVVAVVRDGSFLGVLAEREEQAIKARTALTAGARWSGGSALPDPARLYEHLAALPSRDQVVSEKRTAMLAGGRRLEATYTKPYVAHAAIAPSAAVAQLADGRLTVWTHSQGAFPLRRDLAKALGMQESAIRCIHVEGAGCYGHNGADDVALDAALLARAAPGRPVRLQWMRDDEFAWEPYGAAMVMKAAATLTDDGRIAHWDYELWSNTHSTRPGARNGNNLLASWYLADAQRPAPPSTIPQPAGGGDRNAVPLYDFPNQRVLHHFIPQMPLRVSALRTLGAYANVFAVESFMDELAAAARADPVEFRLAHLKDPRARAVIEAVARMANWDAPQVRGGYRGRGIAFARYKNLSCYVAVVAEVEIDRTLVMRVPRVYAAVDAGQVINPDGVVNQIEGGIVQSASWTLREEVRFDRDGIKSRDWGAYPILTMPEVPAVEVALIDRPDERPLGVGEGSQGPAVGAIANAFRHATGRRLRDLPFTPERVKAVLS